MTEREVRGYADIQRQSREMLRRALLDAATRLLIEEGLEALTMRRIARSAGCSTTVLYTLFGSKQGLVEALWSEGVRRLWRAEQEEQETAGSGDPLARLAALGRAYRRHALENPDYYRVMFGGGVPGFRPSAEALAQRRTTFQLLVDAVRECIAAGILRPEDPELVASVLWATAHGVVSLQLSGDLQEPQAGAVYERALRAVVGGFLRREGGAD